MTGFWSAFFFKDLQGQRALITRTIRNPVISSLVLTLIGGRGFEQVLGLAQGPHGTVQGRDVHLPEVAHRSTRIPLYKKIWVRWKAISYYKGTVLSQNRNVLIFEYVRICLHSKMQLHFIFKEYFCVLTNHKCSPHRTSVLFKMRPDIIVWEMVGK